MYGNKKRQGQFDPAFLLLYGQSNFDAESGRGTLATPIRANPLVSRVNYEAAATATTAATTAGYVINRDSFT